MTARVIARYLAAIAFSLWCAAFAAHAEKRVALVIGNSTYQNTPALTNPTNDAEDLAAALERVGFTVQIERDLTKQAMEGALARFARAVADADAAIFFYAGHGIQYRGTNYLVPVDARIEDEVSINYELTRIDDVMFSLDRARGVKLLVLDACRNNPLTERLLARTGTRDAAVSRGLARVDPARGMIVAYATQADQVAVDGAGRNSPFTSALVKNIDEPGLEVGSLFRRVAIEVDRATGGRQLPELWVTLRGEFYLNNRETDLQLWNRIRSTDDPGQLSDFLQRYPSSVLAPGVRERLDRIERTQADRARIERERLREKAAQEAVERERVAQEQLARERAERERVAEAERAAREAAERERITQERVAREQAERERLAREDAERARLAAQPPVNQQIALLPPASEPPPKAALTGAALVTEIKRELKRVGCLAGALDDRWATADTHVSIAKFTRFAKLQSTPDEPSTDFLDAIKRTGPRVCPLECGARQMEKNGSCVAKLCPSGQQLQSDGRCTERRKSRNAASHPASEPRGAGTRSAPKVAADQPSSDWRVTPGGHVACGRRGCQTVPSGCFAVRHGGGGGLGGKVFCP